MKCVSEKPTPQYSLCTLCYCYRMILLKIVLSRDRLIIQAMPCIHVTLDTFVIVIIIAATHAFASRFMFQNLWITVFWNSTIGLQSYVRKLSAQSDDLVVLKRKFCCNFIVELKKLQDVELFLYKWWLNTWKFGVFGCRYSVMFKCVNNVQ